MTLQTTVAQGRPCSVFLFGRHFVGSVERTIIPSKDFRLCWTIQAQENPIPLCSELDLNPRFHCENIENIILGHCVQPSMNEWMKKIFKATLNGEKLFPVFSHWCLMAKNASQTNTKTTLSQVKLNLLCRELHVNTAAASGKLHNTSTHREKRPATGNCYLANIRS